MNKSENEKDLQNTSFSLNNCYWNINKHMLLHRCFEWMSTLFTKLYEGNNM